MDIQDLRADLLKKEIMRAEEVRREYYRMRDYIRAEQDRRERLWRLRDEARERARRRMKLAARRKDYREVRKLAKQLDGIKKQTKAIEKLNRLDRNTLKKIDRLEKVSKRIEKRLEKMALREAKAVGVIEKRLVRIGNAKERLKMTTDRFRRERLLKKMERSIDKRKRVLKTDAWKSLEKTGKKEWEAKQSDHKKRAEARLAAKRAEELRLKQIPKSELNAYIKKQNEKRAQIRKAPMKPTLAPKPKRERGGHER